VLVAATSRTQRWLSPALPTLSICAPAGAQKLGAVQAAYTHFVEKKGPPWANSSPQFLHITPGEGPALMSEEFVSNSEMGIAARER